VWVRACVCFCGCLCIDWRASVCLLCCGSVCAGCLSERVFFCCSFCVGLFVVLVCGDSVLCLLHVLLCFWWGD